MNDRITSPIMLAQFMNLGMAVMATGDTVISACCNNLLVFQTSIGKSLFLEPRLEKSAAAAATVIVGSVGLHVYEIFFADAGFNNETQIFGDRIPIAFSDDLTRILNRELYF